MHFKILVEDQSGKKALDILVPKIIGCDHTFIVHSYKGIGHIPKGLKGVNDSICGTWEKLAEAVFPGGSQRLSGQGHHAIEEEKSRWAEKISPHINVDNNQSPSFCYFRDKLRALAELS